MRMPAAGQLLRASVSIEASYATAALRLARTEDLPGGNAAAPPRWVCLKFGKLAGVEDRLVVEKPAGLAATGGWDGLLAWLQDQPPAHRYVLADWELAAGLTGSAGRGAVLLFIHWAPPAVAGQAPRSAGVYHMAKLAARQALQLASRPLDHRFAITAQSIADLDHVAVSRYVDVQWVQELELVGGRGATASAAASAAAADAGVAAGHQPAAAPPASTTPVSNQEPLHRAAAGGESSSDSGQGRFRPAAVAVAGGDGEEQHAALHRFNRARLAELACEFEGGAAHGLRASEEELDALLRAADATLLGLEPDGTDAGGVTAGGAVLAAADAVVPEDSEPTTCAAVHSGPLDPPVRVDTSSFDLVTLAELRAEAEQLQAARRRSEEALAASNRARLSSYLAEQDQWHDDAAMVVVMEPEAMGGLERLGRSGDDDGPMLLGSGRRGRAGGGVRASEEELDALLQAADATAEKLADERLDELPEPTPAEPQPQPKAEAVAAGTQDPLKPAAKRVVAYFDSDFEWETVEAVGAEAVKRQQAEHAGVSVEAAAELESSAATHWDVFYGKHRAGFFKDRHYLLKAFPELAPLEDHVSDRVGDLPTGEPTDQPGNDEQSDAVQSEGTGGVRRVLEVGCGAGNTLITLLRLNPELEMAMGCDFAPQAVEATIGRTEWAGASCGGKRAAAFVWDVADLSSPLPPVLAAEIERGGGLDAIVCIFVLSAIAPELHAAVARRLSSLLRVGGHMLFRDYGRWDMSQLRYPGAQRIGQHFYQRQDGTRCYYFELEDIAALWPAVVQDGGGGGCGGQGCWAHTELKYCTVLARNRKTKAEMRRVWAQARLRKL